MEFLRWHYEIDTLPRFEVAQQGGQALYDLYVPVGYKSDEPRRLNLIIEFKVDGGPINRIGFNRSNPLGHITPVTSDFVAALRVEDRRRSRHYLEMEENIRRWNNRYAEGRIKNIPEGSHVQYRIAIFVQDSRQIILPG